MKKRLLSWLLCAAMVLGLLPTMAVTALADELAEAYTLSDDYISVSVSKKNGGFTVRTVEGDRLKKSDNNKKLLYHDGQYDTSFLSFRVGDRNAAKDYLFGGKYPNSSGVTVTEENGTVKAVWSVDSLTFTQSISLANTSSNESGMVSLSLSVTNSSGTAVPVQTRILYDTALGEQDFGYYQYNNTSTQITETISQEKVLTSNIPQQLFATDDPYSPSVVAYSVNSDKQPTQAAFGHWSHLASTLFDFTPVETLDFTNTRSEYMTADSAYALYFDLGSVAAGGSTSLNTYYGVFSNHQTPASDSVAVNLTAPVRLRLNDAKNDFLPESDVKGSAHFAVTVDFTNIAGEGAQELSNVVLAVRSSRNLCSLTDEGGAATGQDYETTDPFTIPYAALKVGESKTKTLYFKAKVGTDAAYERITVGVYKPDANGQLSETNKLGERMAYVLLPGSDGDVPKVSFAAMTPKIIYTEGTRHLFVTVTNPDLLGTGDISSRRWSLKAYSEDGKVVKDIPHVNITIKDGIMDVALTENIHLSEGGWYLQLEWTDAAVSANIVTADKKLQTAPELHFTVSADKKYKNDAYGVLAVVEYKSGSDYSHQIVSFKSEDDFNQFKNDTVQYEEILLTFKGEFTKKTVNNKDHYIATSTKTLVNGKHEVDNPIVINGCMDFEGGSLEVYYDAAYAICTEFDGELYTNTERTSIWKGKAIFTKIEMRENYSLIPYNENGERGSYDPADKTKLMTDNGKSFNEQNKPITLIWPSAAGIGQTLSGMIFKLAYAQLGIMYDTENQTNKIEETIGCVVSFTAALDLTFASGKVDENAAEPPTYWSKLQELWSSYDELQSGSLYQYAYNSGKFERALDWSEIDESGGEDNEKNIKGSVMVRDVLFGCGEGFIGVNFEVGVAIKNYISGLPEIEGTIAVSTINDWAFGVDGKIKLANFTVEAKVSFKSKNNIPIPDELYVFVSGFEPGLNIDGCGVIWLTGAGGGIKNIYDTIFMTQAVPPLKLLLSVSFDVVKVLTCAKATLSLGLTGISLQAENIGIKKIESLKAIDKMGLSLEWYPGIDLRANIVVNLFDGIVYGGGYIVLISPDYKDVFFEMFARAKLSVPGSVPIVGGMTLAGIDLGISTEKVWGALDVLFITLGVTYYWGEGSVDFSKGSKSNPTFPDLLGYDDIPVYYDAERDQTLYARVGTNTQIMATSLPDDGGLTLMSTGAELHCTEGNSKTAYWFNLGQRQNEADAIVQITFDANDMTDAKAKAAAIKVGNTAGGSDFGLVLYEQTIDAEGNLVYSNRDTANANLSYDETTKKATYAFTATKAEQYGKPWYMSTPEGSDVILYNVSEVPKVETVSGMVDNNAGTLTVNWDGSELSELDQISFYLCSDKDAQEAGYRIGKVDRDLGNSEGTSGSAPLTIPADVPSGEYYIRGVYSKSDEVNGVVFSKDKVRWTNRNTPGAASFTAKAAGNLQYELTIPHSTNTDGYLVTVYNADGTATDFQQVSYDAAAGGSTVINVGGSYTAMDADGNTQEFGLTGGKTYTIGVTPYKRVETNNSGVVGETAVYGAEVKQTCALPKMVTPTVTFSADKAAQSRTETQQDKAGNTYTAKKSVYTSDNLTITAKVSEAVTGTWRLDNEKSSTPFTNTASISIPLPDLTEGEHTITMQGAAADGDSFAATYTFTVDTLPPQLLLSSPVNGSFFGKDGTLTVTGVTDADARFTITADGGKVCENRKLADGEFDPATGVFSFTVSIPDPHSASQHTLTITTADDVGNATVPQSVTVSHGGLADLASLEVMVNGQTYSSGNLPVPAAGLKNVPLTLVGVTSKGTKFNLTGYNVNWELTTVEGTASLSDGALTAAVGSQGILTGKLAVANGAYRTASLCFGALANHIVAVSATIGGSVTGGGEYNGDETVTLTAVPDSGYRFAGWTVTGASVADLTAATITFTMPRVGNVTALAQFTPIAGSSVSSESVSAKAGEIVRVKLPVGKSETEYLPCYTDNSGKLAIVPISAVIDGYVTFLAPKSGTYRFTSNPAAFSDTANHWAAESIAFCAARELFKGVGGGRFAPDAPMTRAMFATVLYRIAGMPAVSGANSFYDVAAGQWYTDAILWGQSTGIISGYGNGLFGTNDLVTREQMCVMLSRYLQWAGYALPAVTAAKQFGDNAQIADWAAESIRFCQMHGLINGRSNGLFAPKENATRAENSAVLRRVILAILSSVGNR